MRVPPIGDRRRIPPIKSDFVPGDIVFIVLFLENVLDPFCNGVEVEQAVR